MEYQISRLVSEAPFNEYSIIIMSMGFMFLFGLLIGSISYIVKAPSLKDSWTFRSLIGIIPWIMLLLIVYDVSGLAGRTIATGMFSAGAYFAGHVIIKR